MDQNSVYHDLQLGPSSSTSIRLLQLEFSKECNNSDLIRCQLTVIPRDSPPRYTAISYVWGEPVPTKDILINGTVFPVGLNLWTLLNHLRSIECQDFLWIDAICINQNEDQEKNEQVDLMNSIYRNAEEAFIWLGLAADGSDRVMDVLNELGSFAKDFDLLSYYSKSKVSALLEIAANKNPEDPATKKYHDFCESMLHKFDYSFISSLKTFQARPWLRRTWVLQEFALPRKVFVVCGHKSIQAELLMMALQMISPTINCKLIERYSQDKLLMELIATVRSNSGFGPFFILRQKWQARNFVRQEQGEEQADGGGESLSELLQLVHVGRSFQATLGCDMIYGLLGLAEDAGRLGIKADYSEKDEQVRTEIAYTRTARAIIASGRMDFLYFAQHMEENSSLPSWVPDWRSDIEQSFAWLNDKAYKPVFCASKNQPMQLCSDPCPSSESKILSLKGFKVDSIEEVSGPWSGGTQAEGDSAFVQMEDLYKYIAQIWEYFCLSKAKNTDIYPSAQRRDEAIWRIPIADLTFDETYLVRRATEASRLEFRQVLETLEVLTQRSAMNDTESLAKSIQVGAMQGDREDDLDISGASNTMYYWRILLMIKRRRTFMSQSGYVGLGSAGIQAGDLIVVLAGADVPFIVRPVGGNQFRLLGECYCDGIMDGEIVDLGCGETITLI